MLLPQPLVRGRLVARYKRFFADLVLDDGREIVAHCPNPGAMLGLNVPGLFGWASWSADPKRKLAWTLQMIETDGGLVGINTMAPNRIVAEALAAGAIPELAGYASVRPEVKYAEASRVDFLLEHPDRPPCWLEVKGVTLRRNGAVAEWPDCQSARGARHVADLQAMVAAGQRAVVLFVVQRSDCDAFQVAADLDPKFAAAFARATASGVEVLVHACETTLESVTLGRRIA
jgi:sugar fermentation stimulation protein A